MSSYDSHWKNVGSRESHFQGDEKQQNWVVCRRSQFHRPCRQLVDSTIAVAVAVVVVVGGIATVAIVVSATLELQRPGTPSVAVVLVVVVVVVVVIVSVAISSIFRLLYPT